MIRTATNHAATTAAIRALDGHTTTLHGANGDVPITYSVEATNEYIALTTITADDPRPVTVAAIEGDGRLFIVGDGDQNHAETATAHFLAAPIREQLDAIIAATDAREKYSKATA